MINLFTPLMLLVQANGLPSNTYAAPTEARAEIDGFDVVCRTDAIIPATVRCEAVRAVDGGFIFLNYGPDELRITITSERCGSGGGATARVNPGAPLALTLPWTLNKFKGSCKLPTVNALPRNTGEFEKFVQLMTAKR